MLFRSVSQSRYLFGGLAKDVDPLAVDNSRLTDDEIATKAIPRNTHISDIITVGNQVNDYVDYVNSIEELSPEPDPKPAPESAPEPIPQPQTE